MMNGKLVLGLIFGGRSGEHDVSLMSARSVLQVLDPYKYQVVPVGITRQGQWFTSANGSADEVLNALLENTTQGLLSAALLPDAGSTTLYAVKGTGAHHHLEPFSKIDVLFPLLHGTFGEDGTMQGLFELADTTYVGAGVLASSVGMDKALFKDVMRANGLPVVPSILATRSEIEQNPEEVIRRAEAQFPYPIFTKPANLGSSVGITKCRGRSDLFEGLMEAAAYDRRILVERGVPDAREIEVSVLGNASPEASIPGEVRPSADFYTYEAKYLDDSSELIIPAQLPKELVERLRELAVAAYRAIDGAGMARVDFLLDPHTNEVYLSEVNTIPGFTRISMYPKLWEASGLPYAKLVDRLIELALERKAERDRTERQFRRKL